MIPDLTVEPFSRTTTKGSGLLYELLNKRRVAWYHAVSLQGAA